jgi:hypothetical protein
MLIVQWHFTQLLHTFMLLHPDTPPTNVNKGRIFKLLRSPRIDSEEPIPPGCVALCSLADRYDNTIPTRFLFYIDCLKIPALNVVVGGGVPFY